jgi:shikimate kinase
MNIILIGFRGTGKTTIGKTLANRLKYKYLSTDEEIKKNNHQSVSEIIENNGWRYFRKCESEVVRKINSLDRYVIDTGGGSILTKKNRTNLSKNGVVILLTAPQKVILHRISKGIDRPRLTDVKSMIGEIRTLLKQRKDKYYSIADHVFDTSKYSVRQIVNIIISKLKTNLK